MTAANVTYACKILDQRWNPGTRDKPGSYEFLSLAINEEAPVWRNIEQIKNLAHKDH